MPIYALLGATGSTGSAIVRKLLASPPDDLTLNIYVRSRSKLLTLLPTLQDQSSFKVNITEAPLTDSAAMQTCLCGADVIFSCVASNVSAPDSHPSEDAARAITEALSALRSASPDKYATPTVLVLSSASLNKRMSAKYPYLMKSLLMFALHYCYSDVGAGNDILLSHSRPEDAEAGLLLPIFVTPGGLMDPDGTEETGYELSEEEGTMVSYADLGAGMVELAAKRESYWFKSVAVNATGPLKTTPGVLVGYLGRGILSRFW